MKKINQAQLLEFSGATQRNVENWMSRLALATKYEHGGQRVGRGFSKENVVEITLLSRMVKNGMSPASAAEFLAKLFKEIKARKPHGYAIFFTKGNMPIDYMVTDKPPTAQFISMIDGAFVINVAKLETDVDELFARGWTMTDKEVEAYFASEEFFRLTHSDEFHNRWNELFRRLDNEPMMTVEQSAKFMHLHVDVFRHLWSGFHAWEAVKPMLGTEH